MKRLVVLEEGLSYPKCYFSDNPDILFRMSDRDIKLYNLKYSLVERYPDIEDDLENLCDFVSECAVLDITPDC